MIRDSIDSRPGETSKSAIAGGFVLVPVAGLMAAWRACRGGPLGIGDFRAWLAAREIRARRCRLGTRDIRRALVGGAAVA